MQPVEKNVPTWLSVLIVAVGIIAVCIAVRAWVTPQTLNLGYAREYVQLMDSVTATTSANPIFSSDFRNITCDVDAVSTTATLKFAGSISFDPPSTTVAKSATNQFEDIQVVDLENGAVIDGDDGLVFTGTSDHRLITLNSDNLSWVVPYTSTFATTTGTGLSLACKLSDNQ